MKECTSRTADWRFLLRTFTPKTAVCFGGDQLAAQTACFSATLLSEDAARDRRSCELAVSASMDEGTLRGMWAALADGGTCYVETRHPRLEPLWAVRRRLRSIGFHDVQFFLPRRIQQDEAPRAWVPLDRLAASLVITPEMSSSGTARRIARAVRRIGRFVGAKLGAAEALVMVAHRPVRHRDTQAHRDPIGETADVAGDTLAIPAIVRRHWSEVSPDPLPKRLTVLLTAPGGEHANKLVAVVLDERSSSPRLVVKLPRSGAAVAAFAREAEALARLHERRPGLRTVPRLLFTHRYEGGLALAQSYVHGVPMSQRFTARRHETLARKMSDWAVELVDREVGDTAAHTHIVDSTLAEFERTFGRVLDAGMLREACDQVTTLGPLPRAFEQRDFSPWNILMSRGGELSVVDWESAEPDGLPVMDLWYGLTYLAFYRSGAMGSGDYVDAYRSLLDAHTVSGAIAADTLLAYLSATRVSKDSVRPLRLLCWMLHSRSEYRQMRRAARGSPTDESLRAGLFVRLWTAEMRHAS